MAIEKNTHIENHPGYERVLRIFADVHPREGATSLILIANIFLILAAFYVIKPVREGWLAITEIGDLTKLEIKAYSAFAQSILLVGILLFYARLMLNWSRHHLILRLGILFSAILVGFWLTQPSMFLDNAPVIGNLFSVLDGMAILNILIGTRVFELINTGFVPINIFLVSIWIGLSLCLHREHARENLSATIPEPRQVL